jgi:hypothetical protein
MAGQGAVAPLFPFEDEEEGVTWDAYGCSLEGSRFQPCSGSSGLRKHPHQTCCHHHLLATQTALSVACHGKPHHPPPTHKDTHRDTVTCGMEVTCDHIAHACLHT